MDPFSIAVLISRMLGFGIVSILHASGADKHKTIAGQVAQVLQVAADSADAAHTALSSVIPPAPGVPTATQTP